MLYMVQPRTWFKVLSKTKEHTEDKLFAQQLFKHGRKHEKWNHAGLMLIQRRRRWTSIKPALGQCLVFTGMWYSNTYYRRR